MVPYSMDLRASKTCVVLLTHGRAAGLNRLAHLAHLGSHCRSASQESPAGSELHPCGSVKLARGGLPEGNRCVCSILLGGALVSHGFVVWRTKVPHPFNP